MSIEKLSQQLKILRKKRNSIISKFMDNTPIIVGSITQTKGRCGKPNCACVEKPIHDVTLLMYYENGKKKSKLIRKNDVGDILKQWENYKLLKKMLAELKEINKQQLELLKQLIQNRRRHY